MPTDTEFALTWLRENVTRNTVIYTRLEVGRGEADYVAVYVVAKRGDGARLITNISYYTSVVTGYKLRKGRLTLVVGGGQYDKGQAVADALWRAVYGVSIDQTNNWEEIS